MARTNAGIESSYGVHAGERGLAIERRFTGAGVHPFDEVEWETRDAVIGNPAGPVFEQRGVEFPRSWSQNATNIVAQKYFRGPLGSPERERSVKQMVGRVAGTIAGWGRDGGYFAAPQAAEAFEAELTHILVNQMAAFNSPVWFNVGFEERPQCSACFILSVDDTMESILDWNTKEGMIFRGGSGSGINLSKIRSSREELSKGGFASGPVSFMRGADAWAGTIKSGGKTRRAAKMVVLDVDHPDIVDFISCKAREEDKAEALRKAGFDMSIDGEGFHSIQYQNANNSVRVTQEFLDAVERGEQWQTVTRTTGEPVDVYDARDLMNQIAAAAWRCADPGVQYDTVINEWHTCPNHGRINASNPCCFVGDTLVHTDDGLLSFEELCELSVSGAGLPRAFSFADGAPVCGQISRVWVSGMAAHLVDVELESGAVLRCTPEHRFLNAEGAYVEARNLVAGTRLQGIARVTAAVGAASDLNLRAEATGIHSSIVAVHDVHVGEPVPVFDLEVAGFHNFSVTSSDGDGFGAVVHNSEYMHVDDSACNLASINLLRFMREDGTFDVEAFEHVVDVMFLAQEIVVGPSSYPTPDIERNAHAMRQLGLGYANLGALLMARGLPYDSEEGRDLAAAITALMTGRAYRASGEVAAAIGPYDEFAANREPHLNVMRKHRAAAGEIGDGEPQLRDAALRAWDEAVRLCERHGHRNAQATVLAPTGTISFLMDCDTTGIEPDFSLVKTKELVGGGTMTIVNRTVPKALRSLGYAEPEIDRIEAHLSATGTIVGAPGLREKDLPVFDVAVGERAISHMGHIKMMAAVQPFISGAISKTVNMPADSSVEDIEDAYLQGGRLGLKALAVYRDGSKTAQALRTDAHEEEEPAAAAPLPSRKRLPRERESLTHKFSVAGHEGYITAGRYEDGELGEIFLTDIGKDGSTLRGMMNAFATAISIGLQYGVPLETFVKKFSYMRFDPEGMTTNPEIPFAKSLPDYIMRWLASRFLDSDVHEELGILSPAVRARKMAEEAGLSAAPNDGNGHAEGEPGNGSGNGTNGHANGGKGDATTEAKPPTAALTDTPPVVPAKLQGLDLGPACSQCGGMMQRTGSCYTCTSCGNNTGCG